MKVGWLVDVPKYAGGAELTMQEFAAAAPDDVTLVECPKGAVVEGLDRYVIGNCVGYAPEDIDRTGDAPKVRYIHDVWPHGHPEVRERLLAEARVIFCSPLHRERFPHPHNGGRTIPPALDLSPPPQEGGRRGNVWLGRMYHGKGIGEAQAWAAENGPTDFYGYGPIAPQGENVTYKGEVEPGEVKATLARYETFVFLPTLLEPFARTVVEAWVSGCKVVANRLVGALYWMREEPDKLETAAADFWAEVTR